MNKVPKLLHIDTTSEIALIGLSIQDQIIAQVTNQASQQHASFVQTSIESICKEHSFDLNQLDGIVVTLGPGSYTGMRVGLASAKGIAYALDKPLIGLSSLALIAKAANKKIVQSGSNYSLFSMIDARRMEIFGAIYDANEQALTEEQAIVLDIPYLTALAKKGTIYCAGSGASKIAQLIEDEQIQILDSQYSVGEMLEMAMIKWEKQDFEDLAYVGPTYIKDVYTIPSKQSK
ncbi:MAG: tRNA (adenosine(37)-N6)-threonylcarbamoyltransferase complex dimerization subunit type 1 TsaB [Sediminibacterium sp.]